MIYIYSLIDPRSPDIIRYIGKTKNPKKRLSEHINDSKRFSDHKSNWIKSLVEENIKPEMIILESCDYESSFILESHYISVFKSDYLTNSDESGMGNFKLKTEIIENAKYKYKKVYQFDLNGNFISEFRSVRSASRKLNISHSNIVRCCNGVFKHTNGFVFLYEKVSFDPIQNPNAVKKKVVEVDKDGNIINEWCSLMDCSRSTKISSGNISRVCNKQNKHTKGRIFLFK